MNDSGNVNDYKESNMAKSKWHKYPIPVGYRVHHIKMKDSNERYKSSSGRPTSRDKKYMTDIIHIKGLISQ